MLLARFSLKIHLMNKSQEISYIKIYFSHLILIYIKKSQNVNF